MMNSKDRSTYRLCLLVIICTGFLVFLHIPIETYFSNINDFIFDFYDLIKLMVPVFLGIAAICAVIFYLAYKINVKLWSFLTGVLFSVLLALYIESTFLCRFLPEINGSSIDWDQYPTQRLKSCILWIVLLVAVAVLLCLCKREKILGIFSAASKLLLLMFVLTSVISGFSVKGFQKKEDFVVSDEHLFDMSKRNNFIILVLDGVNGYTAEDFLFPESEDSFREEDEFDGFTFYRNASGSYSRTALAVPFILSGKWFENQTGVSDYYYDSYYNSEFLTKLSDSGYKMGLYHVNVPQIRGFKERYENIIPASSSSIAFPVQFIKTQIKLSGIKCLPFDLKKFCTVLLDSIYVNSMKFVEGANVFTDNNLAFSNALKAQDITLRDEPVFKYIHISGSHVPFEQNTELLDGKEATYENTVWVSLNLAKEYLKKLKQSGVYDNSVIFVMADHGSDVAPYFIRQNPLLMIKGINERHTLEISDAPISHEDLLPAYYQLLDGKQTGENLFPWEEGDIRTRRFLSPVSENDDGSITEYTLNGFAADKDCMVPTGNVFFCYK